MCSVLFFAFFTISLASFLNTSFVCPFFHPFLSLSLLVSLSWFVSSSWIFSIFVFFIFFFSPFFTSFSWVCFFLFGAHFSCSLFFLLVAIVVWFFFVAFRISCFFGLFNFFEKKKTRFEKTHPFLRIVFPFFQQKTQFFEFFLYRTLPSSQKNNVFF